MASLEPTPRAGGATDTCEPVPTTCSYCEPRRGWRSVGLTQQRTVLDFARQRRWLVDESYTIAAVFRLVLNTLNTGQRVFIYESFAAPEARHVETISKSK